MPIVLRRVMAVRLALAAMVTQSAASIRLAPVSPAIPAYVMWRHGRQRRRVVDDRSGCAETRDQTWLDSRLKLLCETTFADAIQGPIVIRFGTKAQKRLGSIALRGGRSHILINQLLAHPDVPEYVTDGIIAHEMAHYCHGFGSSLPRLYRHPHRGAVVDKELERRGVGALNDQTNRWIKADWMAHYERFNPVGKMRAAMRRSEQESVWTAFLAEPGMYPEVDLQARFNTIARWYGAEFSGMRACWFHAGVRRAGVSWYQPKTRTVLVHGLLARPGIPSCVRDEAMRYWIVRLPGPEPVPPAFAAERAALNAGQPRAARWMRAEWQALVQMHHPLRGGTVVLRTSTRRKM